MSTRVNPFFKVIHFVGIFLTGRIWDLVLRVVAVFWQIVISIVDECMYLTLNDALDSRKRCRYGMDSTLELGF